MTLMIDESAAKPPTERALAPPTADALLSDGTIVTIRPLLGDDQCALLALNDAVGSESLRFRFFAPNHSIAETYARHLLEAPDVPALVALHEGDLVAIASAEPVDARTAEVALLVADRWHGLGVGGLLLEHLAAWARERGVDRFVAEVLLENHPMLEVFAKAGFTVKRSIDSGVTHLELDTAASVEVLLAADEREYAAERRSLRGLLHPRSVAVYGVRHDGSGIGATILRSIVEGGFHGPTYVVHPEGGDFAGAHTVRSLRDADNTVDLAVLTLAAQQVLAGLQDVADAHTNVAVVISAGFAEAGEEGSKLQRTIVDFARSHDIRLVGPNCFGVAIDDGEVRLDATVGSAFPSPGRLAIASQSGGVGIELMDLARSLGLGVGAFISLGNKCDVSGNDLLAAWRDDDAIEALGLYLESFGNVRKFARFARRFAEHKPILAVLGGQSPSGDRADPCPTAAAVFPAAVASALFKQSGVIECADADELATTALLLTQQPLPGGERVAIVSNVGGMARLAADTCARAGLIIPDLSPNTSAELTRRAQSTVGFTNPVDAEGGIEPGQFAAIARGCLASNEIDALIVIIVATAMSDGSALAHSLEGLQTQGRGKPVVLVALGDLQLKTLDVPGVTIEPTIRAAARALAGAAAYARWRSTSDESAETPHVARSAQARALAATLLVDNTGSTASADGWLDVADAQRLLAPYGLAPLEVVALQRESVSSVELALGLVRDATFGPLLIVGAGAATSDLSDDRAFLIPPITRSTAEQALRSLRLWPSLVGDRGSPGLDTPGVVDTLRRLSLIVDEVPEIMELDINLLIVDSGHCALIDVRVRLETPGVDAGIPRRLRAPEADSWNRRRLGTDLRKH